MVVGICNFGFLVLESEQCSEEVEEVEEGSEVAFSELAQGMCR